MDSINLCSLLIGVIKFITMWVILYLTPIILNMQTNRFHNYSTHLFFISDNIWKMPLRYDLVKQYNRAHFWSKNIVNPGK